MAHPVYSYKTILVKRERFNSVVWLTLNRPSTLNGWNDEFISEMHAFLDTLAHPDEVARVVIVRGAGRAFSAGADLTYLMSKGGEYTLKHQQRTSLIVTKIRRLPQVFIAAIHGSASGAGFSLALACDIRVCTHNTKMNAAFIKVGLTGCELGSSFALPRMVGTSVAAELLLTGKFIDGIRAERVGLVSACYENEEAMEKGVRELTDQMIENSIMGLRLTKECLNSAANMNFEQTVEMEDRQQVLCMKDEQSIKVGALHMEKILGKKAKRENAITSDIQSKL